MARARRRTETLGQKQERFSYELGKLIVWLVEELGVQVRVKEVFRTQAQADANAAAGVGIKRSLHRQCLAADLYLVRDGVLQWDGPDYDAMGNHWKSQGADHCWGGLVSRGGDFRRRNDVYHVSVAHGGRK